MFPVVTHLSVHMIDGTRRKSRARAIKPRAVPAPKAHGGMGAERNADDMLEYRPVLVPPDPGACTIFDEKRLLERALIEAGEGCGASTHRFEPLR